MKKMIAAAGMMVAMVMAVPAQADHVNSRGAKVQSFQVADLNIRWFLDGFDVQSQHTNKNTILPLRRVARMVENNGQRKITDIALDKNQRFYRVTFINRKGQLRKAKVRSHNGSIYDRKTIKRNAPNRLDNLASIYKVIGKARSKGARHFDRVDWKGGKNRFIVRGLNKRGKPVKIEVGPKGKRVFSVKPANNYNGPNYAKFQSRPFKHWQPKLSGRFNHVGPAVIYDDAYVVLARNKKGRPVEVVVDRYSGEIIQVNRLK